MGPYKIEASENLIDVRTAALKPRFTPLLVITVTLSTLLGIYVVARSLPALASLFTTTTRPTDIGSLLVVVLMPLVGCALLWRGLRLMFPSGESLVCNADTLTIGHIPDHVLTGRWTLQSFPTKSVRQITFGPTRFGRWSSTTGFIFQVDGKKIKVLFGLEAPEADQILQALAKLGVDTVHDPAMPMMVDMTM